jgi:hypothetical protein
MWGRSAGPATAASSPTVASTLDATSASPATAAGWGQPASFPAAGATQTRDLTPLSSRSRCPILAAQRQQVAGHAQQAMILQLPLPPFGPLMRLQGTPFVRPCLPPFAGLAAGPAGAASGGGSSVADRSLATSAFSMGAT